MALRKYVSHTPNIPKVDDVTVVTPPAEPIAQIVDANDAGIEELKRQIAQMHAASAHATPEPQQPDVNALHEVQQKRAAWLHRTVRDNPHAMKSPLLDQILNAEHQACLREGIKDCSPDYFTRLESRLEQLAPPPFELPPEPEPEPEPQPESGPVYSAPVSRGVPSSDTGRVVPSRITLTREQVDMARAAGIKPEVYAENLIKMRKMKAAGLIQDGER